MKKRFLAVLLALVICLGLAAPAFAADEEFVIDENGVLVEYHGPGGDVVIPEGVTAIGIGAFAYRFDLTSVTIPEGVTEIGVRAFGDDLKLATVNLPDSVTVIGESAFYGCDAPTSIRLPSGLTELGLNVFWLCTGLTSITIPEGVTKIGNSAFALCSSLTTVSIPQSVTDIGVDAFEETPWLERQGDFVVVNGLLLDYQGKGGNVTVPKGVTEIRQGAFSNCKDLTSVAIPEGVTKIGASAFYDCEALTSVTLPKSLVSIGFYAFENCAALTALELPGGVTEIGNSAFDDCAGLTSVVIPSGVTEINRSAFSGCTGLTDLTLPDTLTKIDSYAFSGCAGLTSVVIPEGVTEIGGGAFEDCTGLTSITIPNSIAKIGDGAFSHTPWLERQGDFPVFNDTLLEYQGKDSVVVIPDGITAIGDSAFISTDIIHVTIPDSVTRIGDGAFYGCSHLNNVTIPGSVTEIGDSAFGGCDNMTNVAVPASVTRIGENAFACMGGGGDGWIFYYIPDGLTIYGVAGSYAETYAKENKIPFTTEKPLAFADLRPNAYYLDAVDWAVSRGVTTGTTPTTFSPKQTCTHGQILTFLWRAAGEPESSAQPPIAMRGDEFYYKAVKWAAEKGMIDKNFNPKADCTRAYAVLYIWQAFGKPAPTKASPFTDIPAHWSSAAAAAWAAEKGVTTGTTATTFNPNSVCNRGEIVTFLYRAYTHN